MVRVGLAEALASSFDRRSFQSLGSPEQRIQPRSFNDVFAKKASLPGHCFPQVSLASSGPGELPVAVSTAPPPNDIPTTGWGPRRHPPKSIEPYTTPLLFWGCECGSRAGLGRPNSPQHELSTSLSSLQAPWHPRSFIELLSSSSLKATGERTSCCNLVVTPLGGGGGESLIERS